MGTKKVGALSSPHKRAILFVPEKEYECKRKLKKIKKNFLLDITPGFL